MCTTSKSFDPVTGKPINRIKVKCDGPCGTGKRGTS